MSELFVEFICEEIPARLQKNAINHMAKFLTSSLIISNSLSTIFLSIPSLSIAKGLEAAMCIASLIPKSLSFSIPSNFTTEIIFPIF
mgnify:CR=1 FL=1